MSADTNGIGAGGGSGSRSASSGALSSASAGEAAMGGTAREMGGGTGGAVDDSVLGWSCPPPIELLHIPAAVVESDGRVLQANARLERILGLPRGLLAGRDFHALYRDPSARATLDFVLSNPTGPETAAREDEFYLPTPDGGRMPVLLSASRMVGRQPERFGIDGARAGLLVTFVDISRIKEAEGVLREHFAYVTQLSDTALEQAIALRDRNRQAEKEASTLRDQAAELEAHSRELFTLNQELERRVAQRTMELRQANLDAIYMLAVASEAKDHDTGSHVRRLRVLAQQLAARMGFNDEEAYDIGLAAVLHDVGKIHVPDAVLSKPGPLDDDERRIMQQHTLWGQRILPDRIFFNRSRLVARSHHENFDGSGYPDGLAGDQIPIEARIVHVVDVYDALTNQRVYKSAWRMEDALREIREKAGSHFDPEVVAAFTPEVLERGLALQAGGMLGPGGGPGGGGLGGGVGAGVGGGQDGGRGASGGAAGAGGVEGDLPTLGLDRMR